MIGKLRYLLNLELQKQGTFEEHLCTHSMNSHLADTVLEWNVIFYTGFNGLLISLEEQESLFQN